MAGRDCLAVCCRFGIGLGFAGLLVMAAGLSSTWAADADSGGARQLPATPMPVGRIKRNAEGKLVPDTDNQAPEPEAPPPANAPPPCLAAGPGPQIQLQSISESIGVNQQHSLDELQKLGPGGNFHPLGMYRASLKHDLQLEIATRSLRGADGKEVFCVWIQRVALKIGFLPRNIMLAREYRLGSCEYGAIFGHEMRHAQIDDAVLGDYLPKLRTELRQAAAEASARGAVVPGLVENRKAELRQRMTQVIQGAATELDRLRNRAQSTIDTPSEYRRVAESCPSHLRPGN